MAAGSSARYYSVTGFASQRAARARAAVQARQMQIWKQAVTAAARLDAAERAYQDGDICVAGRIYTHLALSRKGFPATAKAKQRLAQLAEEARIKRRAIDSMLVAQHSPYSPSELSAKGEPLDLEAAPDAWRDSVTGAFREYEKLRNDYEAVPSVRRELRAHIGKQRRRPDIAVVLKEPEAASLLEVAQQHEKQDELCCAYWVYARAARLLPAPSAQLARHRLIGMKQDDAIVASAMVCRELRVCHQLYHRAEILIAVRPTLAKEQFTDILRRAPERSEVHRLALEQVEKLDSQLRTD